MEPRSETSAPAQRQPKVRSGPTRKRLGRSKATNDPAFLARDPTTRLRQSRRRRDLIAMFIAALPGATDLMLVAVRKAAELTVAAEAARAAVLNGGGCAADLDMLVKLEGEARRAVRALGLKLDAAKPHVPLREQLAAEAEIEAEEVA